MAWNASLQRATFTADAAATFALPERTARLSFVVAGAAPNLGGATLQLEVTQDGTNYGPIPGGKDVQATGALAPFSGKVLAARAVLAAYASSVVVTLVAEVSRDHAMSIPVTAAGAAVVTTVTPA